MRIYLMRHATAADPAGTPDALRPLTDHGRQEAREAGRALRDMREVVSLVLTSPRLRARETAELVLEGIGRKVPIEVRERLTCGATSAVYRAEIDAHPDGRILFVAHNPEISAFASELVGATMSFRPATLAAFGLHPEGTRLIWVRHPSP